MIDRAGLCLTSFPSSSAASGAATRISEVEDMEVKEEAEEEEDADTDAAITTRDFVEPLGLIDKEEEEEVDNGVREGKATGEESVEETEDEIVELTELKIPFAADHSTEDALIVSSSRNLKAFPISVLDWVFKGTYLTAS